jgi:predicted AlkP superfamily pyrophosphatase or phosphodiesterase
MKKKLLVIQAAGLGYEFLRYWQATRLENLEFQPCVPVFPALTCTAQAAFRTGADPVSQGMPANGFFLRPESRAHFWDQAAAWVEGPRIWSAFRDAGRRVGLVCWQQSLGESVDLIFSPAPIHRHGGGMIQSCYAWPRELEADLREALGRSFNLFHYWGPVASPRASHWIAEATAEIMTRSRYAPDLLLTYLPALDYDLQRYGPEDRRARGALEHLWRDLRLLLKTAAVMGYEVMIAGDYAITRCGDGVIYPNRRLAETDWMVTRRVGHRDYPDYFRSRAFALVDHEVAWVYLRDPRDADTVRAILAEEPGIGSILGPQELAKRGWTHPRAGDLLLTARPGWWFAYPWWTDPARAPEFDRHVDIHNKPGYDPCELFFGWPPISVSRDTSRIRGTHGGLDGPGREAAWAATWTPGAEPTNWIGLATAVREWMETVR